MNKSILTQERLKELLHYNPETGVFTWLVSRGSVKAGTTAKSKTRDGYIRFKVDGSMELAHRLAWLYMTGAWPEHQIDHINHIKNDNRIGNLRPATQESNNQNASMRKDNTSGVTGVRWDKRKRKYQAQIHTNKTQHHLGYFDTFTLAVAARKSAEAKYGFHKNHGNKKGHRSDL